MLKRKREIQVGGANVVGANVMGANVIEKKDNINYYIYNYWP